MTVTPTIAAVLLLHVTLLSAFVSYRRITLRISWGEGDNRDMRRAIRAHGNALEHALPFLLLLFFLETKLGQPGLAAVWWYGWGFVAARLLHSVGVVQGVHRLRQLGATVSVLLELVVGVALLRACLGCCAGA